MRSCGDCKACCWAPEVPALSKEKGTWCQHCDPKAAKGCQIYDSRPAMCSEFNCLWRAEPKIVPESLYPAKSRVMISAMAETTLIVWELLPGAAEKKHVANWIRMMKSADYTIIVAQPRSNTAREV